MAGSGRTVKSWVAPTGYGSKLMRSSSTGSSNQRATPETARNHLKRIYPKLGVASQAELFALFFKALERVEPGLAGDPLTRLR